MRANIVPDSDLETDESGNDVGNVAAMMSMGSIGTRS